MVEDTVTSRRVRDALPVFTALASVLLALAIAVTLYLAREILVPIAFAIILSFLLAPLVRLVQRPGLPRSVAVVGRGGDQRGRRRQDGERQNQGDRAGG